MIDTYGDFEGGKITADGGRCSSDFPLDEIGELMRAEAPRKSSG